MAPLQLQYIKECPLMWPVLDTANVPVRCYQPTHLQQFRVYHISETFAFLLRTSHRVICSEAERFIKHAGMT